MAEPKHEALGPNSDYFESQGAAQSYQAKGLEAWAPAISALVALFLGVAFVAGGDNFCIDDAWIHLSYAKSWAAGDGLSYNPGDWETGFSSPLWVLCLLAWPLDDDPVAAVKLLGVLFHCASAWLACTLALEIGHRRASVDEPQPLASLGLLTGVLVATQVSALRGATSGMEVSLCAALCLAVGLTLWREAWLSAAVLSALAVWARPEALAFIGTLAGLQLLVQRKPGASAAIAGGLGALAAWIGYCTLVSGHPWPNTYYVKTSGEGDSLAYLSGEVLAQEPWVVSVGGLALVGASLIRAYRRRESFLAMWAAAWLIAMVAIAWSRPLHPGVLFFESRYFAILAAPPLLLVALGVSELPRVISALALAALLGLNGWTALKSHDQMRAQERSVSILHTSPARDFAELIPPNARIVVEGAGATRYFAARDVEIIDALGLNRAAIAHAPDDRAKACELVRAHPSFALLPDHIAQPLATVFEWEPVRNYLDPDNAMVRSRHPMQVSLYRIQNARAPWNEGCL